MEELFDKELQGMVRFTDATQQDTPKPEKKKAAEKKVRQEKTVQQPKDEPTNVQWEPVKGDPNFMDRLKACAKWVALFGGLSILIFYWQQTGQMEASAAVPSMCVCALMAGVGVGRNWWK